MFVGLGPTFQMWNPQSYEIKRTQMIKNAKEKKLIRVLSQFLREYSSENNYDTSSSNAISSK